MSRQYIGKGTIIENKVSSNSIIINENINNFLRCHLHIYAH